MCLMESSHAIVMNKCIIERHFVFIFPFAWAVTLKHYELPLSLGTHLIYMQMDCIALRVSRI